MCGIAGFSLTEGSKTNARLLAHHLLKGIETRGSHASGFAYVNSDGEVGVYKQPKPGSQLSLAELPRRSDTVVLHTRFATQGSPQDNHNNHPVVSKDSKIALVHNGVISNDFRFRDELGLTKADGEVDSLVIPNLIAQQGIKSLSRLGGYAAIAWVNVNARGVLNIMRLKQSPVHYTWLHDGSFVFASTEAILVSSLLAAGLDFGGVFEMQTGKHMTISNGFIHSHDPAPSMSYDSGAYSRYSSATAGGHGSTRTSSPGASSTTGATKSGSTTVGGGSRPTVPAASSGVGAVGAEVIDINGKPMALERGSESSISRTVNASGAREFAEALADGGYENVDDYFADLEEWRRNRAEADERDQQISAAHLACSLGDMTDDIDDDWDSYTTEWLKMGSEASKEGYYLIDIEGGLEHASTVDALQTRLRWYAQMGKSDGDLFTDIDEYLNWINHVQDVGHITDKGDLVSWVDDSAMIDDHESPLVHNLKEIREGAQRLSALKGA